MESSAAKINKALRTGPLRNKELVVRLRNDGVPAREAERIPGQVQRGAYPDVWVATPGGRPATRGTVIYYYRTSDASRLPKGFGPAASSTVEAPPAPHAVAVADIWVTRAIERLESEARREESLPAEPRIRAEAQALRAATIGDILREAPARLSPVHDLLPSFPSFGGTEGPPNFGQVMGWLNEVRTILDAHLGGETQY